MSTTTLRVPYGIDPTGGGFFWPSSEQKRSEMLTIKRNDPSGFDSTYQCRPGGREGHVFLEGDFVDYAGPIGLENGISDKRVAEFCSHGQVIQAWDTASSVADTAAWTVCVTALLLDCDKYHRGEDPFTFGPCEHHYDVLLLDVHRERYEIGALTSVFKLMFRTWVPDLMLVEKKSSGITLFQAMPSLGLPVLGIEPEGGKRDRATSNVGAGSAQGWFRQNRVLYPMGAPWAPAWKRELKDFTGMNDSISDQVDATVHLIRYAIKLSSTRAFTPTNWTPERGIAGRESEAVNFERPIDPRGDVLFAIANLEHQSFDPWAMSCGHCRNYDRGHCRTHDIRKIAMDTCSLFQAQTARN